MKYVIAVSGPVAVGKTALTKEIEHRFATHRISTRQFLLAEGASDDRASLIEKGKELDQLTDGTWVRDKCAPIVAQYGATVDVVLVDAVRTERQVHHLRQAYGRRFVHIHLTANPDTVRKRYESRAAVSDTVAYDVVRADSTESGVWQLDKIADRVVVNERCEPPSLLALAISGLSLFPLSSIPLVDVIISAQYGSEGKGQICAYLAEDYSYLVRVGGPNAGHQVADPRYNYRQLPSGTGSNPAAKILIAAGSTIQPDLILKEMKDLGVEKRRIIIDEQALVIDQWDRDFEDKTGGVATIGSTKQGAGAALARKILNRGNTPVFGGPVCLAKDHPVLQPYVGSVARELEDAYAVGGRVMLEGTQGTWLSLHHGQYPNVTARETTAAGCLADAGIAPARARRIVMVTRRYPIRVGGKSGPMGVADHTGKAEGIEIDFETVAARSGLPIDEIKPAEHGSVSRNLRRIAEFDWEQVRRSAVLNGATDVALTFSDYIAASNRQATRFEQLTDETRAFIAELERVTNAPVSLISTRFDRFGVIDRRSWR
ncbi:adenylosuccinate synthetase [Bradyrhizobium sp. CCBAU 53421]|uniref:adenylosuccinate synthetase n=1 Tax=Bradyrhizobium sp. CCBAU 53421 TaxID=1325120 RepID=UPI00188C5641|nr:adenylosuccinate synthetase [Bradyrhizobium sp. CCBAU 53421]QOZ32102.1 adenylosuccinate synthase [Bradyrhizobium sp. CCBAU 53421]